MRTTFYYTPYFNSIRHLIELEYAYAFNWSKCNRASVWLLIYMIIMREKLASRTLWWAKCLSGWFDGFDFLLRYLCTTQIFNRLLINTMYSYVRMCLQRRHFNFYFVPTNNYDYFISALSSPIIDQLGSMQTCVCDGFSDENVADEWDRRRWFLSAVILDGLILLFCFSAENEKKKFKFNK